MTKTWTIAALGALLACGGSSNARVTKSFSYGAPAPASGEALASASGLEGGALSALQFRSSQDGDSAATSGASVAMLPDALASALDATALALRQAALAAEPGSRDQAASAAVARAVAAAAVGDVTSGCWTATPTSVTFTRCGITTASADGSFSVTLDGTISKPGADEARWDLTATASASNAALSSLDLSIHYFGDLTVTATSVDGFAQSDKSATAVASGQSVSLAYTTSADFEHLVVADGCVSDGAVELKRIWTRLPQQAATATEPFLHDRALRFTWQDCGVVLVASST